MECNKVNIPISFEKIKTFNVEDDRFIKCKVWIAHTGVNKNNWIFSKESLVNAIPSLTNVPIVAFVQKNNDSEDDFSDHREVLEIEKGKKKISYKGKAIGVITSENNAQIEKKICDDGVEREFLTCEGLLWSKFDDSIEIFMRDECKDQSMEIDNYVGEFNKYKQFECSKFRFTGLCALGCGVEPAMYSACIDINFSLDEIKAKLEQFNTYFSKSQPQISDDINKNMEGGNTLTTEQIDSIFAEFNVERSTVDFEINDDTTEELLREYLTNFMATKEQKEQNQEAPNVVFSTYNEKREQLRSVIPHEETRSEEGSLEYALSYWIADFDDNYVYVEKEEYKDNKWEYTKGRFAYSESDGKISLTGEFEKMIVKWVTPEESEQIEKAREEFEANKSRFEVDKSEFETKSAEFERLKEFEKKTLADQFKEKANIIFSKFDDKLKDVAEYEVLKASFNTMQLDAIEDKCYSLLGRQNANFSVNDTSTKVVNLGINTTHDEPEDDGYGGLLSRKYNN